MDSSSNADIYSNYQDWIKQVAVEISDPLTNDQQKQAKISFYCMVYDNII